MRTFLLIFLSGFLPCLLYVHAATAQSKKVRQAFELLEQGKYKKSDKAINKIRKKASRGGSGDPSVNAWLELYDAIYNVHDYYDVGYREAVSRLDVLLPTLPDSTHKSILLAYGRSLQEGGYHRKAANRLQQIDSLNSIHVAILPDTGSYAAYRPDAHERLVLQGYQNLADSLPVAAADVLASLIEASAQSLEKLTAEVKKQQQANPKKNKKKKEKVPDRLIKARQWHLELLFQRVDIYKLQGRYDQAEQYLRETAAPYIKPYFDEKSKERGLYYLKRAHVLTRLIETQKALDEYEKAEETALKILQRCPPYYDEGISASCLLWFARTCKCCLC